MGCAEPDRLARPPWRVVQCGYGALCTIARNRSLHRRVPAFTRSRRILACARARARRWRRGARRWCATAPRFNNCVEVAYGIARFAEREAVESDGHTRSTCGVRELRNSAAQSAAGGVRQHPGSTTALRGLMASLALRSASPWKRWAYEIDLAGCASCATRLCGALCGSGRPPRGGRRRSFVGGDRAMLAGPRIGAARRRPACGCGDEHGTRRHTATSAQQRATNTTLAATRRHR